MTIEMKPIRSEADYDAALAEVAAPWGAPGDTPEGDRLGISAEILIQPSRNVTT